MGANQRAPTARSTRLVHQSDCGIGGRWYGSVSAVLAVMTQRVEAYALDASDLAVVRWEVPEGPEVGIDGWVIRWDVEAPRFDGYPCWGDRLRLTEVPAASSTPSDTR
jgi:hypothetical protein